MKLVSKTKIILPSDGKDVKSFLTFNDKSVAYQISKLKQNFRFSKGDPEKFKERMEQLKVEQNKCLLFYDVEGNPWTYSGLWKDLQNRFKWELEVVGTADQKRIPVPYKEIPPEMREYQKEAVQTIISSDLGGVNQCAIELPTGSGKTNCLVNLIKHYGVKTLIVAPFSNITGQLCKDLEKYFGTKYVGQYGDGKKKTDKMFTVATAQAITRVVRGSKEWNDLVQCKMIIFDESHFVATETFKSICLEGVAEHYPYRFFLSATQTRTDGSELLLRGVTGPVVYRKSFKDLAGTFLKTVNVKFFNVPAGSPPQNDPKRETRNQLYNNPHVAKMAATLAEKAWLAAGRQTVILIEEYEQFVLLKNYLGSVPYGFAHGTVSALAKDVLPEAYWKCDVDSIVKRFNDGSLPILIGTTAVATGVDIRPTGCLIYLQGGISEIKVKQGVGRGTRPVAHPDLWVVDFNVQGSPTMERHARARAEVYSTLTDSEIKYIG